ncbi:MAG: ABC transporter ATP-binding protein [Ignavibacteria bacterium]|nr:ABC transporter ATP-binding protein [Ignavibacteria bacterium]
MISVSNLNKTYPNGVQALKNVSFEISKGDICGYIGTNGAGKSTTVKIISGSLNFDSGKVRVNGIDVKEKPVEVKRITGFVPELPNMFNSLTPLEFFDFVGKIRELDSNIILRRYSYFAELFDFKNYLNLPIGKISKGNRQKILITSSLIHNPDIILFDEPLSGLDANSIILFQDMTEELARKGKTVLYCSHLLDMIEKISSKIIIIENGSIIIDKPVNELSNTEGYSNLENLFRDLNRDSESKKFVYKDAFE